MTLSVKLDATGLSEGLASASEEINRLAQEEIAPAAAIIEDAFAGAARSIERELARAARTGELSLKRLGRSIVLDLTRSLSDSLIRRPIESLLTNLFSAPFGGARAEGGLVSPGAAFLVGERGPEIFRPAVSGSIGAMGGERPVNVTINLPGVRDADSFRASQSQIAAGLSRAMARGGRNQ